MVDTQPSVHTRVEVAFTTAPDDPVPAFQDLTSRLDRAAGGTITRGRQDEYGAVTPGTCGLTLDNTDGELTAGRAASSFYPNVKPSRRMRVTYRDTTVAGNLLTANQASIETSSNDYTTTSAFGYIGGATKIRSSTHALDGTWSLHVTWPTTGAGNTAIEYTPLPGLVIGRTYLLSLSVWVPTGSPGVKAAVLLTATSATSTVFDAWQRLSVPFTATAETHYVGVQVTNSTAGQDVWVDSVMVDEGTTLNTFTTNAAPIEYRFDGYVEEWPTEWPGGNKYTQAPVNGVDLLARLGTKRTLRSVVEETVFLSDPVVYYPLGEPEESTMAADVTGTNDNMMTIAQVGAAGGTLTFGTGTGPGTDNMGAPQFAPASVTSGRRLQATTPPLAGFFDFTILVSSLTTVAANMCMALVTNDFGFYLGLFYDATGHLQGEYFDPWTGTVRQVTSTNTYNDGQTWNFSLTVVPSGGSLDVTLREGGTTAATATWPMANLPMFNRMYIGGRAKDRLFTGTISHVAAFNSAVDVLAHWDIAFATNTGFAGERSDQRIARIASWAGIPTARQILDVGQSTSIAHVDPTGKKPLEYLQLIADTEQGVLFADTQGRLVFKNRTFAYTNSTVVASVNAHDVGRDTRPTMSKQELLNDMSGKRTDGPEQRYKDQASFDEHGGYSDSLEIAVTSDADVMAAMQWRVNGHAQPMARVPNVDIDAYTNTAIAAAVRALDVTSRLQVTSMPTQASTSTLDLLVQGYTETIATDGWQVNANTTMKTAQVMVWDDATYGKWDSGFVWAY